MENACKKIESLKNVFGECTPCTKNEILLLLTVKDAKILIDQIKSKQQDKLEKFLKKERLLFLISQNIWRSIDGC